MFRGRAYRRWVLQREKDRVRRVIKLCWYRGRECLEEDPTVVGRMASVHLKPCSKQLHGCGNPRRSKGYHQVLTLDERRALLEDTSFGSYWECVLESWEDDSIGEGRWDG